MAGVTDTVRGASLAVISGGGGLPEVAGGGADKGSSVITLPSKAVSLALRRVTGWAEAEKHCAAANTAAQNSKTFSRDVNDGASGI